MVHGTSLKRSGTVQDGGTHYPGVQSEDTNDGVNTYGSGYDNYQADLLGQSTSTLHFR